MTIQELIEMLEDAAEIYGDDLEIRIVNLPFEYSVGATAAIEKTSEKPVFYIASKTQLDYVSARVRQELK